MSMLQRGCVGLLLMAASACTGSSSTPPATPSPTATTFALSGQITDSVAATGIAGATVSVADGSNAGKSTTTDVAGNYALTGLTSSTFTVSVAANLYVSSTRGVTLTSNQTLSFQLARVPVTPSTFTVSGAVTDGTSGGILPNIVLQITDGSNAGKSATTDGTGNYAFTSIAPGTFTLSAAAASYETTTRPVTVAANTRVDFVLQRVAPSCSFTVSPLHLSYTTGGFSGIGGGILVLTASAPTCTWTADDAPNDWLSLSLGSGQAYSHSVSGTGSANVLTGGLPFIFGTRTTVVRVRWIGGGIDVVACQPNC